MTSTQWNELPELVRRREVLALGVGVKALEACVQVVNDAAEVLALPPRTIAAIRTPRPDGKRARLLYFKQTIKFLVPVVAVRPPN